MKLLIVEDNLVNIKVLVMILQRLGYEPSTALNGEECMQMVKSEHFDMIFMDLQMPVMDGMEASKQVLELSRRAGKSVFITALTANADMDHRTLCENIGLHDFVAKPVSPSKIMEVMSRGYGWLCKNVTASEKAQ